jgi:hypothetical protein
MKKYLITILTLLIMLVGQSAGTAAASGGVTLVGVSQTGHGAAFTFRVSGKFSKAELKGSVHVENGWDYALHCTQVDEDTVKCKTSQKVSGANVSVTFGGSTFWTYVPEAPDPTTSSSSPSSEYCYNVYDWSLDFWGWEDQGDYCQGTPAEYNDMITWYNPVWQDTYDYEFLPGSPDPVWCPFGQSGDAYYFPYSVCDL